MKRIITVLLVFAFASTAYASATQKADEAFNSQDPSQRGFMAVPSPENDTELQALIAENVNKFQVKTYSDDVSGLSIQYNIYFPEGYSPAKKYPAVVFIFDARGAGQSPEYSLTNGYGALSWFDRDAVVIVPVYPGVVLDDHRGFILTDYVELTGRFIRWAKEYYGLREIYGTGQSMGCMTTLVLASKYHDLYTACLFVSGQWDINTLEGLTGQKFIYVASAGDTKASTGQREVIDMFSAKGVQYVSYQNVNAKSPVVSPLPEQPVNFITFKKGTTLQDETQTQMQEHMTSFDYGYKIKALRDWLFAQKEEE